MLLGRPAPFPALWEGASKAQIRTSWSLIRRVPSASVCTQTTTMQLESLCVCVQIPDNLFKGQGAQRNHKDFAVFLFSFPLWHFPWMARGPLPRMNSWETSGAAENNCNLNEFFYGYQSRRCRWLELASSVFLLLLLFVFPDGGQFSSTAQFLERPRLDTGEDTSMCT